MSVSLRVPRGVPSLSQSSRPFVPPSAVKKTRPPRAARPSGFEEPGPGWRSRSRRVPSAVPSVTQSSTPWSASSPTKSRRSPRGVSWAGGNGENSLTRASRTGEPPGRPPRKSPRPCRRAVRPEDLGDRMIAGPDPRDEEEAGAEVRERGRAPNLGLRGQDLPRAGRRAVAGPEGAARVGALDVEEELAVPEDRQVEEGVGAEIRQSHGAARSAVRPP